MRLKFLPKAQKSYLKLPANIRKKAGKSFELLLTNPRHPSLGFKKKKGSEDIYEVRIDRMYRYTLIKEGDLYGILTIGPHDKGLGNN